MYSFTGTTRARPTINLGGAGGASTSAGGMGDPSEVRRRAKAERAAREERRRRELAAIRVQSFYRSRKVAASVRDRLRSRFDSLLAFTFPSASTGASGSSSGAVLTPTDHVELARLLNVFYLEPDARDASRLARWAREVVSASQVATGPAEIPLVRLLDGQPGQVSASWRTLVGALAGKMLKRIGDHAQEGQAVLYLEVIKVLLDGQMYAKSGISQAVLTGVADAVARQGLWLQLRRHVLAHPVEAKTTSTSLLPAIQLSLAPFSILAGDELVAAHVDFVRRILTIPLLPNRIPIPALTQLSGKMPFDGVLASVSSVLPLLTLEDVINLLANLLAFGSKRVSLLTSKSFVAYLSALRSCLDLIPTAFFAHLDQTRQASKTAPSHDEADAIAADATEAVEDTDAPFARTGSQAHDANGDITMADIPRFPAIDSRTYTWLATLSAPAHLAAIVAASNKSSATSRPAFCGFLVSVLFAWPSHRERVINTLLFTGAGGTGERGGGLLREIWRGYVRSSKLGLGLRDRKTGGTPAAVVAATADPAVRGDWEALVLLSELYARCLLTLGDDEFFNDHTKLAPRPGVAAQQTSAGRNPLMLEEVIGLAGLLRNIAFGLYWTEGQAGVRSDKVAGTRVGVEEVRSLATRLLQQIHARDSRRSFCEEGFWLMTSTFDLQSFIQTVVSEEAQLDEDAAESHQDGSQEMGVAPPHARPIRSTRDRKSQRQLAFVSPRLGVLNNIPFVIPFDQRVAIFRTFVENDRKRLGIDRYTFSRRHRHRAVVRRGHIAEDGFAHLNGLGPALKDTIEIAFVDQHGMEEAGIDGGGVFKEFLTSLSKEAFDNDRGLWLATPQQELYPNPHAYARESANLAWYGFLGRCLGKALYEGILIELRFAGAFLSKWLGRQVFLDDLASLDPELYQGLLFLKNYNGNVESDLSLNFTVTNEDFGVSKTLDLIPNGRNIAVTNENRMQYITLVAHYRLNVQTEKQCAAFFGGLSDIIEPGWIRMFNQQELRVLVGGTDQEMDVDDLASNCVYGGWDESHPTVRAFWRVVKSFDDADRRKLLKFCTSCARPPLLGFRELNPSFALRNAGDDVTRLPSASTCVNLLKLPAYDREDTLRAKLKYAINSEAGFDLS